MRIQSLLLVLALFSFACTSAEKKHTQETRDSVVKPVDTAKFSAPLVKSVYSSSDLVAKIKVITAFKKGDIYIVTANLLDVYKGQTDKTSEIKYEAFLEEGNYNEFLNKTLIIFLKKNTQDKELYTEGIHWGRTEPNVEFAYSNSLKNFILNIK